MDDLDLLEKLRVEADRVAADIQRDNLGLDVSYDLWVEQLPDQTMPLTVGVIDMGDVYQAVYHWCDDRYESHWQRADGWDPREVLEEILINRTNPDNGPGRRRKRISMPSEPKQILDWAIVQICEQGGCDPDELAKHVREIAVDVLAEMECES